jgi:hypothetical protein
MFLIRPAWTLAQASLQIEMLEWKEWGHFYLGLTVVLISLIVLINHIRFTRSSALLSRSRARRDRRVEGVRSARERRRLLERLGESERCVMSNNIRRRARG